MSQTDHICKKLKSQYWSHVSTETAGGKHGKNFSVRKYCRKKVQKKKKKKEKKGQLRNVNRY